jgi:hypothetical protein
MTTSRSGTHQTHPAPSADEDPLDHADRGVLVPSGSEPLDEQGSLLDEDGDDIREYTGEPVETDEGWVVPQTQNSGGADAVEDGEGLVPHQDQPT